MKLIKTTNKVGDVLFIQVNKVDYVFAHRTGNTNISAEKQSRCLASGETLDVIVDKLKKAGVKLIKLTASEDGDCRKGDPIYVNPLLLIDIGVTRTKTGLIGFLNDNYCVTESIEQIIALIGEQGINIEEY